MSGEANVLHLSNLADTERLGRQLGAALFPGAVVSLVGPLGAGKTALVRAVAEGLGLADPTQVTSPTFVLIQEYATRWPLFHLDVYRLKTLDEFLDLGIEEYLTSGGVCIIEWGDRVAAALPTDRLNITLEATGEHARRVTLVAGGPCHQDLLDRLSWR